MKLILSKRNGLFPKLIQIKYLQALNKKFYVYPYNHNSLSYCRANDIIFDEAVLGYKTIITFKSFGSEISMKRAHKYSDDFYNPVFEDGKFRFDEILIRVIEENPNICGNLRVVEVPDDERFIILQKQEKGCTRDTYEEILMEKDMVWYKSETDKK